MKIMNTPDTGRTVVLDENIAGGFLKKGTLGTVEGEDKFGNISVVWNAGECGIRMPMTLSDKFSFVA